MPKFKYFNSPDTTFDAFDNVFDPIFDNKHNTVTYHDEYKAENLSDEAVDNVFVVLPYIWARAPDDGSLGTPGRVALDFEHGAWTAEDFNGIEGLDLKVTAKIVPLNHPYSTGTIAAGSIASDASLTDDFGPSSADKPIEAPFPPFPPETLDKNDRIPSVDLGELEAHEDVVVDLKFTYKWTLDGKAVDYNALRTSVGVYTLDDVKHSNAHHMASAADDLWFI
jgi:hypothetical protein